jgi:hypothetical protein
MEKKYLTRDVGVLTNPMKMKEYVEKGVEGSLKNYFESAPIDEELRNLKQVSGADFDSSMFKRNMDVNKLVLIKHPEAAKNLDIEKTFNKFAKS